MEYAGAALLAGRGAARAGAGVVCLATPESVGARLLGAAPELTAMLLDEEAPGPDRAGRMAPRGDRGALLRRPAGRPRPGPPSRHAATGARLPARAAATPGHRCRRPERAGHREAVVAAAVGSGGADPAPRRVRPPARTRPGPRARGRRRCARGGRLLRGQRVGPGGGAQGGPHGGRRAGRHGAAFRCGHAQPGHRRQRRRAGRRDRGTAGGRLLADSSRPAAAWRCTAPPACWPRSASDGRASSPGTSPASCRRRPSGCGGAPRRDGGSCAEPASGLGRGRPRRAAPQPRGPAPPGRAREAGHRGRQGQRLRSRGAGGQPDPAGGGGRAAGGGDHRRGDRPASRRRDRADRRAVGAGPPGGGPGRRA